MNIGKIYAGWVIKVNNEELKIMGSMKIRSKTTYVVKDEHGEKSAIERNAMISGFADGSIEYIRSEAV